MSHLTELAKAPWIIKGIYNACDQWCMYCTASEHCLAYRASNADDCGSVWEPFESDEDDGGDVATGMMFWKQLASAEGHLPPAEIEIMLSGDRERQARLFKLNDPLERAGRHYMMIATAYLTSRADYPSPIRRRPSGPTPLEIVTWYHVLTPARIFRALVAAAEAARGVPQREEDALRAAKVALIGIDRSIAALQLMAAEDDDPRLAVMQKKLRELGPEVERRFPLARAYVRVGLDAPCAPAACGAGKRSRFETWLRRFGNGRFAGFV